MKIVVGALPLAARPDLELVSTFDDVIDALQRNRDDRVLVIAEPEVYERSSRVARTALTRHSVVLVVVDGHRTARAHIAAALCTLSPEHYALAEAVAHRLRGGIATRFALTGVSRLADPAPSIAQQISGWWPPTRFEVDTSAGTVSRVEGFAWEVARTVLLVEAGHDPKGALHVDRGSRLADLVLEGEARPPYASAVWAEQSVGPRDVASAARAALASVESEVCAMCGGLRTGPLCLWCGAHRRGEQRPMTQPDPSTNAGAMR